ncbi:MAG: hypothetical protein PHN56_02930 [Candidatus Nanoarchaeia archaeon]|nr:hypothetical protein [Candidatus Nanoarchaeia archaeon]
MKFLNFDFLIRNFETGELLEKFLVSAVSSILIIRFFLALTGYPTIGSGDFHIAHMLFGGVFMTISLLLLLIFLNDSKIKDFAAILGGVGFGTFIDELGKFITTDNNYFFEPAIALIYVIFIIIYLFYNFLNNPKNISKKEYAINAFELIKEVILNDFDVEEKNKALYFLKKSDKDDSIIKSFINLINDSETLPLRNKNILQRIQEKISYYYFKLIKTKMFIYFIVSFFSIICSIQLFYALKDLLISRTFFTCGLFISTIFSIFFVISAIYLLIKKHRLASYKLFKFSILISIFLTQFFLFVQEQLSAVTQIILNLIVLSVFHNLIHNEERTIKKEKTIL